MSTCNFKLPNLKYNYTLGINRDDGYWDDDYAIDKDSLIEALNNIGMSEWKKYKDRDTYYVGLFEYELYNHESREFDTVYIYVTQENGYYEGVSFDAYIDDESVMTHYSKSNQKKLQSKLNNIERVLKKHTRPIRRAILFSNGEAVYEWA